MKSVRFLCPAGRVQAEQKVNRAQVAGLIKGVMPELAYKLKPLQIVLVLKS